MIGKIHAEWEPLRKVMVHQRPERRRNA